MTRCRCGYDGNGPHPCHGNGYTCRKPAQQRLCSPRFVSLAGNQMKLGVTETWACDACWAEWLKLIPGADR